MLGLNTKERKFRLVPVPKTSSSIQSDSYEKILSSTEEKSNVTTNTNSYKYIVHCITCHIREFRCILRQIRHHVTLSFHLQSNFLLINSKYVAPITILQLQLISRKPGGLSVILHYVRQPLYLWIQASVRSRNLVESADTIPHLFQPLPNTPAADKRFIDNFNRQIKYLFFSNFPIFLWNQSQFFSCS